MPCRRRSASSTERVISIASRIVPGGSLRRFTKPSPTCQRIAFTALTDQVRAVSELRQRVKLLLRPYRYGRGGHIVGAPGGANRPPRRTLFVRRNLMSKREKKQGDQGGQPQTQPWPSKQGGAQPGQQWPSKQGNQPEHKPTTWPTQPGQSR